MCTTEANTPVDVLIQLYLNEDDCDCEHVEDSGDIQTTQDAWRSIR